MASPRHTEHAPYRLNDGRVFIRPIKIKLSDKSDGVHGKAIFIPLSAAEASKLGKGVYDAQGRLLKADESCAFGRVVACGKKANRSTCVAADDQGDFPLPPGTWVVISGSVIPHKPDPFEEIYSYNTSEIQNYYLPGDVRPRWAPEE